MYRARLEINHNTSNLDVPSGPNKICCAFSRDSLSSFIYITVFFFSALKMDSHFILILFIHTVWEDAGGWGWVPSDHQIPLFLTMRIPGIGFQLRTI